MTRVTAGVLALSLAGLSVPLVTPAAGDDAADPSVVGAFAAPFQESAVPCEEVDGRTICKPAGTSMVVLDDGRVLFWDALEGMEDADVNVVAQYGGVAQDDLARVLDVDARQFVKPTPEDGGADRSDAPDDEKGPKPELPRNDREGNDGSMFCSDQVLLADGRVLIAGGTSYYLEPGTDGVEYGGTELEGIRGARLFDADTDSFTQTGFMNYGRWYPSLVTQADGTVLATSGVTKLIKPVYTDEHNRGNSGRNVVQAERYDPQTGEWTVLPPSADKSLPLYPRLRLLPNGNTYYDAAGQTFNPSGQAYDEATWNTAAVLDAETQTWRDLGVPVIGGLPLGFRGSGFTQMLPLQPDEQGRYSTVELLSAGGVIGVTPGTYVATDTATVNTVTIGEDGSESFASRSVGTLNQPRWYGTGVTLPTGQVLVFNGADKDEVVNPSSGFAVLQPEMYDPETETWTPLASQSQERTYHNNAVLLPDGRVLVGGHSPIGSYYANQQSGQAVKDVAGTSNPYRDTSFEVFSPP
ncbi:MAG TPA: kelch repeat-containing protein, partial [Mycobacteriales bacterium]|nr:kelch repeat-containing protein [Mycobacteriales bacterium]